MLSIFGAAKFSVLAELDGLDPKTLKGRVLLTGDAVYASLEHSARDGFLQQKERPAIRGLLSGFKQRTPYLHLSASSTLAGTSARYALTAEGYLAWGLKASRKGRVVLIGGGRSSGADEKSRTVLEVLNFANGRLLSIECKTLRPQFFEASLDSLLEQLRVSNPGARLCHAAPLDRFDDRYGVEWIGNAPIANLSFSPYKVPNTVGVSLGKWSGPFIMLGLSAVAYLGVMWSGVQTYQQAISDYQRAMMDPGVKAAGGINTTLIDALSRRKEWLETPPEHQRIIARSKELVAAFVATPGVRINEFSMPAVGMVAQGGRAPDFSVGLTIPRKGESALIQGQELLSELSARTGLDLRFPGQGGYKESDKGRRQFIIEGFLK